MIVRFFIFFLLCYMSILTTFNTTVIVLEKRDAAVEALSIYTRFVR